MNRLISIGLSMCLGVVAIAPAVKAQATPDAIPANAETIGMAVTPFNLVFLAYQGFFESEGVPKFNALLSEYRQGNVTPEQLVEVAITMRRLGPDTINDRAYLAGVRRQLDSLTNTTDN